MRDDIIWVCSRFRMRPTQLLEYFHGSPFSYDEIREALVGLIHDGSLILESDRYLTVSPQGDKDPQA